MSSSKFEAPRFCPKHLKIHVCEEMDVTKKVKDAEGEIGARVRRLHGTQTEEEMATEAAKQAPAAGSIGAILAAAKNKIAETKKQIKDQEIDSTTKAVSQDEVNDRMAALKARMAGGAPAGGGDLPPSAPRPTGGLGEVIEHAREISNQTWSEYKVPERSRLGEEISDHAPKQSVEKIQTPKKTNANFDKMPSIAINTLEMEMNDYDLDSLNETPSGASKVKKTPKMDNNTVFTVDQTQELIQEAVKKALEEVGIVNKTKKKPTTKAKPAAAKAPAKKAAPAVKKPAAKAKPTTKAAANNSKKPAIAKAKPAAKKPTTKK
jgi:hypothetical protein